MSAEQHPKQLVTMLQYLLWWFRGVVISSGFILCWNWWLVELSAALFAQSYVMDSSKASPRADGPAVVSVSGGCLKGCQCTSAQALFLQTAAGCVSKV